MSNRSEAIGGECRFSQSLVPEAAIEAFTRVAVFLSEMNKRLRTQSVAGIDTQLRPHTYYSVCLRRE